MNRRVLAIDPGTGLGAAFVDEATRNIACATGRPPVPLERKIEYVAGFLDTLIEKHKPTVVLIERPKYMDSDRGQVAARSDSLVVLCAVAFAVGGVCAVRGVRFEYVPIVSWKGTMSKEQTRHRIERILHTKLKASSHAVDALGIALYHLGMF